MQAKLIETSDLELVTSCFIEAFPGSLNSRLGPKYVAKTLEWFIVNDTSQLYGIFSDSGVCEGFIGLNKGYGSTSAMLSYAFSEGIVAMIKRPWLLMRWDIVLKVKVLARAVKMLIGSNPRSANTVPEQITDTIGLVVIGVRDLARGRGIAEHLLSCLDQASRDACINRQHLSVRSNNERALAFYKKHGWAVAEEIGSSSVMRRYLSS